MIRFECDYTEGAIPEIIEKLSQCNLEQTPGYGTDYHCERARELIKKACGRQDVDVHFLVGGTQTNATVIASVLRPHQAVIAPDNGHINGHECGAIEATGHKILALPSTDAKISASQVYAYCKEHFDDPTREHVLQPGMVYISQPTECGTLYSKKELLDIKKVCTEFGICMYIDGARLGYGFAASTNDATLEDIAAISDIFYIGGTKVGAMIGEAVVICNDKYKLDFRYHIKQRGGMLAKGRLLGIQFEVLFEDNKYFEVAKHAVAMADKLRAAFTQKGYAFFIQSYTNQIFVIMDNTKLEELSQKVSFLPWCPIDDTRSAARFVTSWATKEEAVDKLISLL